MTTKPMFTRGPLHAGSTLTRNGDHDREFLSVAVADSVGLIHGEGHGEDHSLAYANACLFAAAPDLYAALEASIDECGCGTDPTNPCRPCVMGRAALSKARGES